MLLKGTSEKRRLRVEKKMHGYIKLQAKCRIASLFDGNNRGMEMHVFYRRCIFDVFVSENCESYMLFE